MLLPTLANAVKAERLQLGTVIAPKSATPERSSQKLQWLQAEVGIKNRLQAFRAETLAGDRYHGLCRALLRQIRTPSPDCAFDLAAPRAGER